MMMVQVKCGIDEKMFFLKHAIGGYTCICGCKMNIWSDGNLETCPKCNGYVLTLFNSHPELHDDPDYGPDINTIYRARQIAELRHSQLFDG